MSEAEAIRKAIGSALRPLPWQVIRDHPMTAEAYPNLDIDTILGALDKAGFEITRKAEARPEPASPVWYGTCGHWTADWNKLTATKPGIPTCPLDGAVGFHAEPSWWHDVDAYEADGHPGYRKQVEALEIGRAGGAVPRVRQEPRRPDEPACSNKNCRLAYAHSGPCWTE